MDYAAACQDPHKEKAAKLSKPSASGEATASMAHLKNKSKGTRRTAYHSGAGGKRTLGVCYNPDFKLPADFNSLPNEDLSLWNGE
jgi:hypothetical protein